MQSYHIGGKRNQDNKNILHCNVLDGEDPAGKSCSYKLPHVLVFTVIALIPAHKRGEERRHQEKNFRFLVGTAQTRERALTRLEFLGPF